MRLSKQLNITLAQKKKKKADRQAGVCWQFRRYKLPTNIIKWVLKKKTKRKRKNRRESVIFFFKNSFFVDFWQAGSHFDKHRQRLISPNPPPFHIDVLCLFNHSDKLQPARCRNEVLLPLSLWPFKWRVEALLAWSRPRQQCLLMCPEQKVLN